MRKETTNEVNSKILDDRMFKHIFSNVQVLESFLKNIFDYTGIKETSKVKEIIPQRIIPSSKEDKKDFYGDLVIKLENDNIVNLEAYTNFNKTKYKKSLCYAARLYSNQPGFAEHDYGKCKKVYSINIVNSFNKMAQLTNHYTFQNAITRETLYDGDIQMIFIALDKLDDKGTDCMTRWLKWIKAKDDKERKEISKGDEDMEFAQRIFEDFKGIWPTTEEEYYKFKYQEELDSAKCDIEDEIRSENALAMLKKGFDLDTVHICSGLSEQEILDIAEEHDIKIDTE